MTRQDLKEIILSVIDKMQKDSPHPACAFLWSDDSWAGGGGGYTTIYAVDEEDSVTTTIYAVNEEEPDSYPDPN